MLWPANKRADFGQIVWWVIAFALAVILGYALYRAKGYLV